MTDQADTEEDNEEESMKLPHVMIDGTSDSGSLIARKGSKEVADADDEHEFAEIDMPPMKDMKIPVVRRDSIHVEKFFTSEYVCACRVHTLV